MSDWIDGEDERDDEECDVVSDWSNYKNEREDNDCGVTSDWIDDEDEIDDEECGITSDWIDEEEEGEDKCSIYSTSPINYLHSCMQPQTPSMHTYRKNIPLKRTLEVECCGDIEFPLPKRFRSNDFL